MKNYSILLLLPLFIISGCKKSATPPSSNIKPLDPSVRYDDVYLIMGQSNATGCSPYSFLEESNPDVFAKYSAGNPKVQISYDVVHQIEENFVDTKFGYCDTTTYFGPEIGIAEELSKFDETSYIIKATRSGSCLQTQYVNKDGEKFDLYNRFISFIKTHVKVLEEAGKNPRIRGVFWMQGESDANDLYYPTYEAATQCFYNYLLTDLNDWIYDHFNYVDAYISIKSKHWQRPAELNAQKQSFCNKNEHCYCIKTNGEDSTAISLDLKFESGEDDNDFAHYDSRSMLLLGKTAGQYLIK